ncbi:hypothetical protein GWK48_10390 [Metallosphaera tengchongensis]|uniref:Uncharacterized protein n=1 Tax=Metallosphaera tengchongensis TaxID=1532350 RepID=A0A6N0P074_9CREN|nr:hypothetical protein [Metallosphaera tengchongensis]QKR00741.1 hypothetical protein GWK48_10390 [Metallosphaera tengchongensis]
MYSFLLRDVTLNSMVSSRYSITNYYKALDYFPSTTIYGLTVRSTTYPPSNSIDDVIDAVRDKIEEKGEKFRALPAVPAIVSDSNNYLDLAVVKGPRLQGRTYHKNYYRLIDVINNTYTPINYAPTIMEYSRVGIAMDRVRGGSQKGFLYIMNEKKLSGNLIFGVEGITLGEAEQVLNGIKTFGLGRKKHLRFNVNSAYLIPSRFDLPDETVNRFGIFAISNLHYGIIKGIMSRFNCRLTYAYMEPIYPYIYLEIINHFVRVKVNGVEGPFFSKGSILILECKDKVSLKEIYDYKGEVECLITPAIKEKEVKEICEHKFRSSVSYVPIKA